MSTPHTMLSDWRELAGRETDGLVVSLLWSEAGSRVKVVVADTKLGRQFDLAVAPDRALDAFHHPFLYAGPGVCVCVAAPARAEEAVV
jgi:DNA-binding transcriptional LysR family regulator